MDPLPPLEQINTTLAKIHTKPTLTPQQVMDLTILVGKALYHVRTIELGSVVRFQRSLVKQIMEIVQ